MGARALKRGLLGVDEAELLRLKGVADRLLAGEPLISQGARPRRLRAGRGLEFLELRPWNSGDDPRAVDWRASARSRRPLVRLYRDEAASTVMICLDRSGSMAVDGGKKWTLAVQLCAALSYLLLCSGNRVGLLAFSGDVDVFGAPVQSSSSYPRILTRLGGLEVRREGGASRLEACARFIPRGASSLVISDFLSPDFLRAGLERLCLRGGRVQGLQILSPSEVARVPGEVPVLRDVESGERRRISGTPGTIEAADRALLDLCSGLEAYCGARDIPLTSHQSDEAWADVVLAHVQTLRPLHA